MKCEGARELIPDYALGTIEPESESAVRAHLRGCAACRSDVVRLDEGLALFARAAHAVQPPGELRDRVLAVLEEEWNDAAGDPRRSRFRGWTALAVAAAVAVLAGALAWAVVSQWQAARVREDARAYQLFLEALGGRNVRVATLRPVGAVAIEGSAILYDSTKGQSWGVVLLRSPEIRGEVNVTVSGPRNKSIELRPPELGADGDGATWFVSSSDITSIDMVRVTTLDGRLLASGRAVDVHRE